jgi:hypothetical protein
LFFNNFNTFKPKSILMKSQTQKKLAGYSSLSAAFLAIAPLADSQVIYTNLDIDVPVDGSGWGSMILDLDGDGADDFYVYNIHYCSPGFDTYRGAMTDANGNNEIMAYTIRRAAGLNVGEVIGPQHQSWENYAVFAHRSTFDLGYYGTGTGTSYTYGGAFRNQTLVGGLRFQIGNDMHYGWIRVECDAQNIIHIYDYAYESSPDVAVIAGDSIGGCAVQPVRPNLENLTSTSITLEWESQPVGIQTQIQYRKHPSESGGGGTPTSIMASQGATSETISGLQPDTKYQLRFRHDCNAFGNSPWKYRRFDTPAIREGDLWGGEVAIYSFEKTIHIHSSDSKLGEVRIYNLQGAEVFRNTFDDNSATINLGKSAAGVYLVSVSSEGKTQTTEKVHLH